jgi:MFS family permease
MRTARGRGVTACVKTKVCTDDRSDAQRIAFICCVRHAGNKCRGIVRRDRVGLACGLLMSGLCTGILLGALSAKYLMGNLDAESLKSWGWRVLFIAGGIFGLVSVYLRRYLHETPVFEALRAKRASDPRLPLSVVLKHHRGAIAVSLLATWVFSGIFVLYFLYTSTFLKSQFHYEAKAVFTNNSWSIFGLIIGSTAAESRRHPVGPSLYPGPRNEAADPQWCTADNH